MIQIWLHYSLGIAIDLSLSIDDRHVIDLSTPVLPPRTWE